MNNYSALYLFGPRLSGKTTLGRLLAEKLRWKFVDMDETIFRETARTVDQITENGTNWQAFRNIELALLTQLIREKNIVVSCGGGVGVNNIIKSKTSRTYGEIETEMLLPLTHIFKVVLLPNRNTFIKRVHNDESVAFVTHRPLLDEKRAEEIEKIASSSLSEGEKQRIIILEKVKSTLLSYDQRKELYENLADLIVDTGKLSLSKTADEVFKNFSK